VATMDMDRKEGGCCAPFAGAGTPSNTMWPQLRSTSVPLKWRLHPSTCLATIDMGQKLGGGCGLFGRPFVKRFALCYRSVVVSVCLSVCDVGILWPNGWKDQDETWRADRPWPWPHCVRWGPTSPPVKGRSPQFSAHICCGQMAAWIKMPLGMERPPLFITV